MYEDTNFEPKNKDIHVRETPHLRTLLDYFEKNLKKGYKIEALKYILLNQGYSKTEIAEAIRIIDEKTKKDQEAIKREEERKMKMQIQEDLNNINQEQKKGFWGRLFGK
jgi:uncharacterized protein Smg (DUF494 family)